MQLLTEPGSRSSIGAAHLTGSQRPMCGPFIHHLLWVLVLMILTGTSRGPRTSVLAVQLSFAGSLQTGFHYAVRRLQGASRRVVPTLSHPANVTSLNGFGGHDCGRAPGLHSNTSFLPSPTTWHPESTDASQIRSTSIRR